MQLTDWYIGIILLLLILGFILVLKLYWDFKEFMDAFRDYEEDIDYPHYEDLDEVTHLSEDW